VRYDPKFLSDDLKRFKSVQNAELLVGGLSRPSKMPWLGWSISAKQCRTGGALAKVEGSVCHGCYALKGRYVFPNVQSALNRRQACSETAIFVPAFIFLLREKAKKVNVERRFFRWFDSGDLQNLDMLYNLNLIALNVPEVQFWLPTKEKGIVREFLKETKFSPNLTVRVSAPMIDAVPRTDLTVGSAVFKIKIPTGAQPCPAPSQGNACVDCRSCWDNTVKLVAYHIH